MYNFIFCPLFSYSVEEKHERMNNMQSSYQTSRVYTGRQNTRGRFRQEEKPLFSYKTLLWQSVVSAIAFVVIYTSSFYDSAFASKINNEVRYTLDYTIDWQSAYRASQNTFAYIASVFEQSVAKINSPDNSAPEPEGEEASAPAM